MKAEEILFPAAFHAFGVRIAASMRTAKDPRKHGTRHTALINEINGAERKMSKLVALARNNARNSS
jgi:leucyl-tRNA synthetase